MIWKKPKKITPGHYKPPRANVPGKMNTPRVGRVGKMLPSMKKFGKKRG